MSYTSSEFFINMKSIPDVTSQEYEAFFKNELAKIENGFTVNGVHIDGWLYWYTNHWKIHKFIDDKQNKVTKRILGNPDFRDTEWIISEYRQKAREEKKGLIVVGSRRLGKSEISASIIGRSATIYEGSENVISAGNGPDLKLLSDKIDKGLNNVHPYFYWSRVENDWKKQVTLGYKERTTDVKRPFSTILPRNLDDGNNTEAVAGITAFEFIIEEIGKFPFLRCLEAAIPAFTSPYGWACSPFLIGTGGAFEKGDDAEKLFRDPEAYNFLAIEVKDEPKKYGLFIPGTYRMEAKENIKLGEWLEMEKDIKTPKKSELYNLDFQYSNIERAKIQILHDRELAKKANDQEAYLKTIMYYPLTPEECFLMASHNMFNATSARIQKQKVVENSLYGSAVFLEQDGEKIVHKSTDKQSIKDYPHKPNEDKDCPIMMWEPPIASAPRGVYVAGVDSYKTSEAKYSTSLGSVYIFKRMHDISGENYQDMIVASYVARPKDKDKWNEQARLLIKYYNAEALVENDEMSFIDYMISKNDQMYLVKTPQFARDQTPNSSTLSREYGVSRSNPRMREFFHDLLKRYLEHTVSIEKDDKGSIIKERIGVTQIYDTALLDEIAKFNPDGNFDRIVAFELALAMASQLDPIGKVSSLEDDPRRQYLFNKDKKKGGLFAESSYRRINKFKKLFK